MLLDVVLGPVLTVLLLEVEDEGEALLIGEAVQGASQTVHTSCKGEVGIGEGGSNQVGRVRRHITTFVVTKTRLG